MPLIGGRKTNYIQNFIQNFLTPFIYSRTTCANRAQVATAWSSRDTCTVCGHQLLYHVYKIVAVVAFTYHSSYQCYYLSDYKLGGHVYCLWPPHYYTLGVHVYCLWPLILLFGYLQRRGESLDDCLSLEAETIFLAVPMGHS